MAILKASKFPLKSKKRVKIMRYFKNKLKRLYLSKVSKLIINLSNGDYAENLA